MTIHVIFLTGFYLVNFLVDTCKFEQIKSKKIKITLMGLIIFLFAALRSPSTGIDTEYYYNLYREVLEMSFKQISISGFRDIFFLYFIKVLSLFSSNPQFLLVIIGAFVAIGFCQYVYHESNNPLIIFGLFIGLRMYAFTLTGLRQAVAMSFLWFAYICLVKNKKLLFVLLTLCGMLFHRSAVIFLFIYPLIKIKHTFLVSGLLLALGSSDLLTKHQISRFFVDLFFSGRFLFYFENAQYEKFSFSSTFLVFLLIFILSMLFYNRLNKIDRNASENIRIGSAGIMFLLIGQNFPNMFRIAYYFIIAIFPLLVDLVNSIFNPRSRKKMEYFITFLLFVQYLLLGIGAGVDDYTFFWQ